MKAQPHSVLIIGSGVTALMAAVAFARRLSDVQVIRLDTGMADPVDDAIGTCRPSIRAFHAALGIDESEIVARTRASYRLGTALRGWSNREVFRGHGMYGEALSGVAFHHLWLRAPVEPYESYSINATLAARERFEPPSSVPGSSLAGLDYGLQLDLPAYGQALRSLGRVAGVHEIQGAIAEVEQNEDRSSIRGLKLADGRYLTADSYVDAGGRAAIVRRSLQFQWVDWSDALLVDRLSVVRKEAPAHLVRDIVIASEAGWQYECAAVNASGYSSEHRNDEERGAIVIRQGRLQDPWRGNCVAIGSAAVSLEPSAATGLHTVCRHIERLIGCWPGHDSRATPAEIAFFNRRTALEADRMRDFVQLPYLLNERPEPFWRAAAVGTVSAELARDLALFRERGRLVTHDEDGFERDEWIASLIGFGIHPLRFDAVAAELPLTRIQQRLAEIRAAIGDIL